MTPQCCDSTFCGGVGAFCLAMVLRRCFCDSNDDFLLLSDIFHDGYESIDCLGATCGRVVS
jgi:hypothetical protein